KCKASRRTKTRGIKLLARVTNLSPPLQLRRNFTNCRFPMIEGEFERKRLDEGNVKQTGEFHHWRNEYCRWFHVIAGPPSPARLTEQRSYISVAFVTTTCLCFRLVLASPCVPVDPEFTRVSVSDAPVAFPSAEMLSDSVYNYATTRRGTADQDSDSQYEGQAQLQITSIQKPRNKRKNFKPISSRMVEVSDESEKDDEELEALEESSSEILEYERKTMLLPAEDRSKQRLNNNEVSPMDLSVATRPPSSEADDDSGDSLRHKFILEQLRSQKLYSPGTESLKNLKKIYKFATNLMADTLMVQARSPNSESSEKSGSGVLDTESGRLDDTPFEDDRVQDGDGETECEERKPFEGMREYAESTMQELLAIYGLAGGELAKSVSRQLPPTFLNPPTGHQPH
ncbi:unnamed protein product, partial [Heterotrigona itama]